MSIGTNDRMIRGTQGLPSLPIRANQSEIISRPREQTPVKTNMRVRDSSPIRQKVHYETLNPQVDLLTPADRYFYDALTENFNVMSNRFRIMDAIDDLYANDPEIARRYQTPFDKTKNYEKSLETLKHSIELRIRLSKSQLMEDENIKAFTDVWTTFGTELEENMIKNVDTNRNTMFAIYDKSPENLFDDLNELMRTLPENIAQLKGDNLALENRTKAEFAKLSNKQGLPIQPSQIEAERNKTREMLFNTFDCLI